MPSKIEMVGRTFGRFLVTKELPHRYGGDYPRVECACECGAIVEVISANLRSGKTKSCGCLQREKGTKNLMNHHKRRRRRE